MGKEQKKYWIGFDLGGTKMMAVLYDDKYNPVQRERKKTKAHEGPEAIVDSAIATMQAVLDKEDCSPGQLEGIGVGCPGMVDYGKAMVVSAPNLGWKDMPLGKLLEKRFNCRVELLNDVDAGTYGEYRFGAGKDARCVVGVFPGTGIGGGCVYDGSILHGSTGSCFELGHIPVMSKGPLCGCGQRGCLEAVASRLAIASAAAAAAFRGEAPNLMKAAGTDISSIRSGELADSIKAGDVSVERIVRQAAQWLGIGISITVNLLAPDVIVLGGGLVEAMPEIYKKEVEEVMSKKVLSAYRMCKIELSRLMDDAVVEGAVAWVRDRIDEKIGKTE